MKIRTTADLANAIDADLAWRKKELRYLASRINRSESDAQASYLRAAVALLYAHWEGFVVSSMRAYLAFISSRRVDFERLRPELRVSVLRGAFRAIEQNPSNATRAQLMRDYATCLGKSHKLDPEVAIKADSNLNSERFLGLLALVGLDEGRFTSASAFLDEALLFRRNSVCHGERLSVDARGYLSTEAQVIALVEQVKNEILNAAAQNSFQL
jgi:hypothetical protein